METRRDLLGAVAGAFAVWGAGCLGAGVPSGDDTTPTPSGTVTDYGTPRVEFSEIVANPAGEDASNLNGEVVVLEAADPAHEGPGTAEPQYRFHGYELDYGERRYGFPDLLDGVEPGATVRIYTGDGDDGVDASAPPAYTLHVGSDEPLLADDGERLVLRDREGSVVDEVAFDAQQPGQRWVNPE